MHLVLYFRVFLHEKQLMAHGNQLLQQPSCSMVTGLPTHHSLLQRSLSWEQNMIKKYFSYLLLTSILFYSSHIFAGSYGYPGNIKALPYFNEIVVTHEKHRPRNVEEMDIKIIGNTSRYDIRTEDKTINLSDIAYVKNHTLYIKPPYKYHKKRNTALITIEEEKKQQQAKKSTLIIRANKVRNLIYQHKGNLIASNMDVPRMFVSIDSDAKVDISGKRIGLRTLDIKGDGIINFFGLDTPSLQITTEGANDTNIKGVVNLNFLSFKGTGHIKMLWVNSTDLVIRGKEDAKVSIAGVADRVNIKLSGKSQLEARYLRAKELFIKTYQNAQAHVWAKTNLSTHARDNSTIYYYRKPDLNARHMKESGAVLSMVNINSK